MKRKVFLSGLCLAALMSGYTCIPAAAENAKALGSEEIREAEETEALGFDPWKLLDQVSADSSGNKLFSKTSLDSAMALVGLATDDENGRAGIEEFLGSALDAETLTEREGSLNNDSVKSANGVFVDGKYTLKEEFLAAARPMGLEAQSYSDKEEGLDRINSFVNEKTAGMIPKLFESGADLKDVTLVNTLYFNDLWDFSWDRETTAAFQLSEKEQKDANFLVGKLDGYYENDAYYGVKMDYQDGDYSMYAAIPKEERYQVSMTREDFDDLFQHVRRSKATVYFPTFEYDVTMDLKELMEKECPALFCSLNNLAEESGAVVDGVLQKTKIQVTKEGTKAAAATGISIRMTSALIDRPVEIRFDRPFAYAIQDNATGELLFVGYLAQP